MAHVPVWTSTKDPTDKASEDGYIAAHSSELVRIATPALDLLIPENLNVRESFNVTALVRVEQPWVEKLLPKILDIADSGLDTALKHVRIALEGNTLKMFALTNDRACCIKSDIELNQESTGVLDFGIFVSVDSLRAVHEFVSKTFGYGVCEIGVKIASSNCESIMIVCYNKQLSNGVDSAAGAPSSPIKAAMFKLTRSVGELPLDLFTARPQFIEKFSAAVTPTLRWIFAQRSQYVELISDNGNLCAQYETEGRATRASLGAKIETTTTLADMDAIPLASVNGKYMLDVFNFIKSPVRVTFGVVESPEGAKVPSLLYLDSAEMSAALAQAYRKEISGETTYITRRYGKTVEATKEEATARAQKQNRKANEQPATTIVEPAPEARPVTVADVAEQASEHPPAMREVTVDKELLDGLPAEEEQVLLRALAVRERRAKKTPMEDIAESLRELCSLYRHVNNIPQENPAPELRPPMALIPVTTRPKGVRTPPYDSDCILKELADRAGEEITLPVLKEILIHINEYTINTVVSRLGRMGILTHIKRGVYSIPADFAEQCETKIRRRAQKAPSSVPMSSSVPAEPPVDKPL